MKKYSYSELDRLPAEKIDNMLSEGSIDRPFYMGYLEYRKKKAFNTMRQKDIDDGKEHKYPTLKFGLAAYTYVLENDVTHKEALEFAAHYVGEDLLWLDEVKNKRFNHSKEVYEKHKEHPVQKEMVKKKRFDKSVITNARSVNQMTKRVSFAKNIHLEVEHLSNQVESLENELKLVKIDQQVTDHKVDHIYTLSEYEGLPKKEIAKRLKKSGWKNKDIGAKLGVHPNTITNWFKDFS